MTVVGFEPGSGARCALLAPSYMGKSTAHHAGVALDPEETESFAPWRTGWTDLALVNDPGWRAANAQAYERARTSAMRSSVPFVVTHPPHFDVTSSDPDPLEDWDLGDRALIVLLPSRQAFERAVGEYRSERRRSAPHANDRLRSFLVGTECSLALVTDGAPALIANSVLDAIARLAGPWGSVRGDGATDSLLHPSPRHLTRLAIAIRSLRSAASYAQQETFR